MNLYFLIEGKETEKIVYREWIGFVFPELRRASSIEEMINNNYFLLAGRGYPSYIKRIEDAFKDIKANDNVDHFFVCVDSEELTFEEKFHEIKQEIDKFAKISSKTQRHIIVQNCCIETWFLGNATMMKKNPQGTLIKQWKAFFDVRANDPEEMPQLANFRTRADFHYFYLKEMLRERRSSLSYSKESPYCATKKHYFQALVRRNGTTGHIRSFGKLVSVWKAMGGKIG